MKYILITGASSGIGHESAKLFATRGKNLILTSRRKDLLESLSTQLMNTYPIDVKVIPSDLSDPENVRRLYDSLGDYELEAVINNAGFGHYGHVSDQDITKTEERLRLDVEAVVMMSVLFVRDYRDVTGTQLINVSSAGGYIIVPNAVTYCAAKFFVSSFTEGLARELRDSGAGMRAKVFAPAATRTGFGARANDTESYDYSRAFRKSHSAEEAAGFLGRLYDSDATVGIVDRKDFSFRLCGGLFGYAGGSGNNQYA